MPEPREALAHNSRGPNVKDLHDALRAIGYPLPKHEIDEQLFGVGTQHALLRFQIKQGLRRTGVLDDRTRGALAKAAAAAASPQYRVEGHIRFEYGLPARTLKLRLYNGAYAGPPVRVAEGATDDHGFYSLAYDPGGRSPNIEVWAVGVADSETPLSRVKYGAERHEVLNLVAPARLRPLAPEYDRLTADLIKHLGSLDALGDARETSDRHDLTLLHQATLWDARLIALAALAVKHSAATGLLRDVLYALFRAGLPSDPARLALVGAGVIEKALRKANDKGITRFDEKQIAAARSAFEGFARKSRREAKPAGALSSLHELLAGAGLTDAEEDTFTDLYVTARRPGELWKSAAERGIPASKIQRLRAIGKLGYLTANNAALVASLRTEFADPEDLPALVDRDLHRADTWKIRLRQLASDANTDVEHVIPPAFTGAHNRLDAYAEHLARVVRVSFRTQVVRRMIESDDLRLGKGHKASKQRVNAFLQTAARLGFQLGRVPLNVFIEKHRSQLVPDTASDAEATIEDVRTLTRLYQATPTLHALQVAYDIGFTSARDIAAVPNRTFLARYQNRFRTAEEAALTYRKAQQIAAVTYNVVTMAKLMDTAPRVYALFPPPRSPEEQPRIDARDHLIRHIPALRQFFGSVDYCACDHCRSVLSPAAYFVDLLQFLEGDGQGDTPYDALVRRRPDLPYLRLSCENTNTLMPYVDLANEVLEYAVADGALPAGTAYDTGSATTPELLAEPQHVLPAAYDRLLGARYPLNLPFDLPIETVRRLLDRLGTPLWRVLEALRTIDDLFAANPPAGAYDRATVLAEYLGVSPVEYRIFTSADPAPSWYRLYGYHDEPTAITPPADLSTDPRPDLNSAMTLARRLGVSYGELVQVVSTGFVSSGPGSITFSSVDPDRCDFNATDLLDAAGHRLGIVDFLKINLFVRLWKRLGWTIAETDRALQAFVPAASLPLTMDNIGAAVKTALIYFAHLETLRERLKVDQTARVKLLGLWLPAPPDGPDPATLLADALSLSQPAFAVLKELSGLEPLSPVAPDPIGGLADVRPYRTLRFVEIAHIVRDSAVTPEDLDYFLRHRFDPLGKYRSDADTQSALVMAIAADVQRLHAEHASPANDRQASALTDEILRQKLALCLPPDVVSTFMGLWTGELGYAADETRAFFDANLQVRTNEAGTSVGFLVADDFEVVFGGAQTDAVKRYRLATALFQYLRDTLARELIVRSLSAGLGADPRILGSLIGNADLLTQPGHPNRPLGEAFAAAAARGVTTRFYASTDATGDPLLTATLADVEIVLNDPATPAPPGTRSSEFEGELELTADGAYRFFIEFDGNGGEAEFRLPDVPGVVLRGTAAEGQVDRLVADMKAGVLYRFTFDVHDIGASGARLLIQSERLPKGSLARLALYPAPRLLARARDACAILAKAIRVIQALGLSDREVRYLLTHRADFDGLDWGQLPTSANQVSADQATVLFGQFLRLADYARLKSTLVASADDLVEIFEASPLDVKARRIAELSRHAEQDADQATNVVRGAVQHLGLQMSDLAIEKGLWRLWQALRIVGRLRLPIADIVAASAIVGLGDTPEDSVIKSGIADDFKRAIKTRSDPEAWQRLAKSLFDTLRQQKRDALVLYVFHNHVERFENANQLFEYFLLDPGMEPIAQTSRLRLAISSVQLFIQRCLLNLEPAVRPSAINATHWQWMKRYRVWEANRKIFLFPENWLEPEFRDDKTHLFQELEGTLLQGEVSNELAEDALVAYLKGLERIAQLEMVTMYSETRDDSDASILHVIGRTSNLPHRYFYRRYAYGMWTPWQLVTAEIEGDHVVAVVWRDRLHLFWLTFLERATKDDAGEGMSYEELGEQPIDTAGPTEIDVHLNWSEYFEGRWTPRESSAFSPPIHVPARHRFVKGRSSLHATIESDDAGGGAVVLHVRPRVQRSDVPAAETRVLEPVLALRLASKHVPPGVGAGATQVPAPYLSSSRVTTFGGVGALTVTESLTSILREGRGFTLQFGGGQRGIGRSHRFFYRDNQHTFFVEPGPPVITLPEFEDFGVPGLVPDLGLDVDSWLVDVPMEPETQGIEPEFIADPDDPRWQDPLSAYDMRFAPDWATDPATVIRFDEGVVGQEGGQDFAVVPEGAGAGEPGSRLEVNPGSGLPAGSVLIGFGGRRSDPRGGLNVIGGEGLTPVLMRNVQRRGAGELER